MRGHRAELLSQLGETAAPSKGPPPKGEQEGAAQQTGAEDKRVGERRAAGIEGHQGCPHVLPIGPGGKLQQSSLPSKSWDLLSPYSHHEHKSARKSSWQSWSGPRTKARTDPEPFCTPQLAQTHLALLTQQRPPVGVKLFPFLIKAFLF